MNTIIHKSTKTDNNNIAELIICLMASYLGNSFPFGFQFFTSLAAVFAEEVGSFGVSVIDGII